MTKYRSAGPLATAVSLAVLGQLAVPLFLTGLAKRQLLLPILLGTVVLTLLFVYRAAQNLDEIGDAHPRFTPGQSVGWLLIPLVNIYMTHQVLTALWRESQPLPREVRRRGADFSVHAVNVWLGLTIAVFACGRDLHRAGALGPTVARAIDMAQGVAFIVVVLGIAARQREQWLDLERRRAMPQPTANALR